jgi:hypothetical protein
MCHSWHVFGYRIVGNFRMVHNFAFFVDRLGATKTRVNNKEGKRVSNALYAPYGMFSESHAPGTQKLTNESTRFK